MGPKKALFKINTGVTVCEASLSVSSVKGEVGFMACCSQDYGIDIVSFKKQQQQTGRSKPG